MKISKQQTSNKVLVCRPSTLFPTTLHNHMYVLTRLPTPYYTTYQESHLVVHTPKVLI